MDPLEHILLSKGLLRLVIRRFSNSRFWQILESHTAYSTLSELVMSAGQSRFHKLMTLSR